MVKVVTFKIRNCFECPFCESTFNTNKLRYIDVCTQNENNYKTIDDKFAGIPEWCPLYDMEVGDEKTAKFSKEYKTCETCKHYDPEGKLNMGVCLKNDWPVMMEAHETCDQWEGEWEESEADKKSMYGDYLYQKYKEEDF